MNSIIYPPTIETDFERLCAVYPLIEQMRLEHNRVAELARSDWGKYAGKFRTYAKESKARLKLLLAERNRLKENIREVERAKYTPEQWKALSNPIDNPDFELQLFGDRETLKNKETEATSPLLDELKALNLDTMPEGLGDDPTEDLTTYTEVDPNSHISKTSDRCTFTNLARNESAYLYKDKGVDHFDGDYEHLLKCYCDAADAGSMAVVWLLSNNIGDLYNLAYSQHVDFHVLYFYNSSGDIQFKFYEVDGGNWYGETGSEPSLDTVYYIELERDENVGTYGTIYCYVCTGNYWDDGGTQVASYSTALHTSKKDWRYIYATNSYNSGSPADMSGWMELLDLQEAGVTEKESSDSGSGAESSEESAALSESETGSGVEQSLLSYLLSSSDLGSGIEAAALVAALILGDEGTGADVSMLPWLEAVFGGDEGSGFDALKALIGTAGSGSDMRLHGRTGKVRMPSKGVNL